MRADVKRLLKALGCGLLAGALLVALIALPLHIQASAARAASAMRQENLIASCGNAHDAFELAEVCFTVLLDGRPADGTALFAEAQGWITPQNGEVTVSLAPGSYTFLAAYENRQIALGGEVRPGEENIFVLDVGHAPSAPDLVIFEVAGDEAAAFPLDIRDAAEVAPQSDLNGVYIVRQSGEYLLSVDPGALRPGFHHLILRAENEDGSAVTHMGLRIVEDKPLTMICTVEDLDRMRRDLAGHYLLMNDLDMSAVDDWTPVGSGQYPFTGVFDGGGHEITGFHAPETVTEGDAFSLLGTASGAEIRNIIIREPDITPTVPDRGINANYSCAVIANGIHHTLVENCAVIGGAVHPNGSGYAAGVMSAANNSVVRGVFNSADVYSTVPNHYLPNVGGVMGGANYAYIADCANEGEVKGNHLTGGILGWGNGCQLRRCWNSGFIWGSTFLGAIPCGGIAQTFDHGVAAYGYFVRGQSAIGARAFDRSVTAAISPIIWDELRQMSALPCLGASLGEAPRWAYASLDAAGPLPYGIFTRQAEAPTLPEAGDRVVLPAWEGVRYFYTTDGSDPYVSCPDGAESLDVTLGRGQVLTVFAARQGYRDSEVLIYSAEEGTR